MPYRPPTTQRREAGYDVVGYFLQVFDMNPTLVDDLGHKAELLDMALDIHPGVTPEEIEVGYNEATARYKADMNAQYPGYYRKA